MRGQVAWISSLVGLVAGLGWAACERGASAGGPPAPDPPYVTYLSVTRGSDAQDCPDTASLVERVSSIRGASTAARPVPSSVALTVTFARIGDTFSAAIRSSARPSSVRRLEVPGKTCAALARATAVTLALLLDPDAAPDDAPDAPVERTVPTPPTLPTPPVPERPATKRENRELTLAAGASALLVTLRPLAPAFTGELGLEAGPWRTGLGVLWAPPQALSLGPGVVRESIRSGSLRLCYSPWRRGALRSDLCTGAYLGLEEADGEGYTRGDDRTRPWLAVPIELTLAGRRDRVGWEVAAGALVGVVRQDFSIENLGDAYRPPPVGAVVSLRAVGLVPW
jgi:hypothetical protein